jgi:hypothetical protein
MTAPISRPLHQAERFGRLWWLPSHGRSNGLSDVGWAPIADIGAAIVTPLLAELRAAGVPAHAAPITRRPRHVRRRTPGGPRCRLWVGTSAYARAEEVLRISLPVLLERATS